MTLYRETLCEHGRMPAHGVLGVIHGEGIPECYGGSREEVVIDYQAATQAVEDKIRQFPVWPHAPGSVGWGATIEEVAEAAIDAALHLEKETASTV